MDENLELEQDIDVDEVEETEDFEVEEEEVDEEVDETEEESEGETEEDDEALEYDDEGNVITAEDEETVTEEKKSEEITESDTVLNNVEYDKLKKQYDDRESLIKDVLKTLGVDENNVEQGLAKLAADYEGDSVEDFLKKRAEKLEAEKAQNFYRQMLLDKMIASDMAELHSQFPEMKDVTKFADIPNAKRYAELRDMGLSVKEAYNAANPDRRRDAIANSVKQQAINASKAHLKSNVPIASKDTSVKITRAEMEQMRDMFPEKSDKELVALYKKTR